MIELSAPLPTKDEVENAVRVLNALAGLRIGVNVSGVRREGVVRIVGNSAAVVDVDLAGITIEGYAPTNAAVLAKIGQTVDGIMTFDGAQVGSDGIAQEDVAWASSLVFDLGGDKVRSVTLAGATAISVSNIAKAREVKLVLQGGVSDHALTWQSGWKWPENNDLGPTILKAGKIMTVHLYARGSATSDIIASYFGGF